MIRSIGFDRPVGHRLARHHDHPGTLEALEGDGGVPLDHRFEMGVHIYTTFGGDCAIYSEPTVVAQCCGLGDAFWCSNEPGLTLGLPNSSG